MGTRDNIESSPGALAAYGGGCVELSNTMTTTTASDVYAALRGIFEPRGIDFRMVGVDQQLSIWDLFVLWHYVAMTLRTPGEANLMHNLAHGGPIFLPWHRMFMIQLEEQLQIALNEPDFGLPYRDWAATGQLTQAQQLDSPLFGPDRLGTNQGVVNDGVFADMRVRLEGRDTLVRPPVGPPRWRRELASIPERRIEREAGAAAAVLPTKADVATALTRTPYDTADWDTNAPGFRCYLEGWTAATGLHNTVHMWVGGDMGPGTSPNDPIFYLNHCNVDRIWEAWMGDNGRTYLPTGNTAGAPMGHRLDDQMVALLGGSQRPAQVLDPSTWYDYDDLDPAN